MAKLNFMDRENLSKECELNEELATIGREATNKLVIADPSVSRQHAWVEKRDDGYYLVDKNSSNGSYVNGKKITQQKLSHNDKVQLGNAQLVFEDEDQIPSRIHTIQFIAVRKPDSGAEQSFADPIAPL